MALAFPCFWWKLPEALLVSRSDSGKLEKPCLTPRLPLDLQLDFAQVPW